MVQVQARVITRQLVLLISLMLFKCALSESTVRCTNFDKEMIIHLNEQVDVGNRSVIPSLLKTMEECGVNENGMKLGEMLAKGGDLGAQLALSSNKEWLQLAAYRGDSRAMRRFGLSLLDKEASKTEAKCWLFSSVLFGDSLAITLLKLEFEKQNNRDAYFLMEGIGFQFYIYRELEKREYYSTGRIEQMKQGVERQKLKYSGWKQSLDKNQLAKILPQVEDITDRIRRTYNITREKLKFTGECEVEKRFGKSYDYLFN